MNSNQDFTNGSIFGKMVRFMLPILAALALQSLYGAVDMFIVGRFGSTAGLSGASTGSMITGTITMVLFALSTAVSVLIGQALGRKEPEKIADVLGSATMLFLVVAAILTILLTVFARPLAVLMQAPAEALPQTTVYIRICGIGFVFVVFYNFISSVFRGLGNSRLPLLFVCIACVVNIIGDLILVAGFHLDVAGAAIATIAAQGVSVLLSLLIVRRLDLPFQLKRKHFRFGHQARVILKIGIPLAMQEFLTSLSMLAVCAFINRLGLDASSGYGVGQKVTSFIMLISTALMQCMAPFVSQNVGAKDEKRAVRGMLCGMSIGVVIGSVIALLVIFHGDVAARIFTQDQAVVARAFEYLRGYAPECVVTSILFSMLGYFNGHAKTVFVMWESLARSFLVRLPIAYLMSIRVGASLTGIALAGPISSTTGIITCVVYFVILKKKGKLTAE